MTAPFTVRSVSNLVVYFVTGANRGIGYAVVEKIAARPNTLIYATTRDPFKADKLQQLAKHHSNVRIVKLSVTSDEDHQAAAKQVEAEAGRVDVLLANAGIASADAYQRTEAVAVDKIREHFEVNAVGPIRLFDALFPLLTRSSNPKFVVVSSVRGSIALQANYTSTLTTIYGLSKAAVNFFIIRVHFEHPNITTFPLQPGQLIIPRTACADCCLQHRRRRII